MKLHLPEILRHFDSKPVGVMFADGKADLLKPKDKKSMRGCPSKLACW